jgi:hypothetical protein
MSSKQIDLVEVFIICCGKSGSSTLHSTFINNNYTSIHTHSNEDYNYVFKKNCNLFELIEFNMKNHKEIYIIDSYRDPIERKISSFFQNLDDDNHNSIDFISSQLDRYIYSLENYVSINEIFDYFNIQYFKQFDFEKKYNILKYKNIIFIKLRFEDIKNWGQILSNIFNKNLELYSDNLSENKKYINEYNIIKNEYKIPEYMINIIKNNKEFKIYNTEEKQNEYIIFWEKKTKKSFVNIPEDFVSKDYVELNKDLQHMTEIEAKIHYEYNGYKENRKYKYENIPEDFVSKEYIELNQDLQHITEIEAKIHYEYNGYKENRKFKTYH